MAHKPDLHLVPEPTEEAWTPQAEKLYDRGEISADEARLRSGLSITERAPEEVGHMTVSKVAEIEEVTEDHVPPKDARREAKLRKPPRATTPKAKADRDMNESAKRKTAFGHDPYIRSVK